MTIAGPTLLRAAIVAGFLAASIGWIVVESDGVPPVRGAYGWPKEDLKAHGFNTVNEFPDKARLDAVGAAGMRAVVWLGTYNRCAFERSDSWITSTVQTLAGHPAVAAWQISDEPNYHLYACPGAPQQHRDRTALIHRYDSRPTYIVISTWDGRVSYPYQHWAGTTDIMGADVYPCGRSTGTVSCDWGMIDRAISELSSDGVSRYWAVMGAFEVCFSTGFCYDLPPDRAAMDEQFRRWSASRMEGWFLYHWSQQASWMTDWCAAHAYCREAVAVYNGGASPDPSLSPSPSPAPSPSRKCPPGWHKRGRC